MRKVDARRLVVGFALAAACCAAAPLWADPLDTQVLKFQQLPMDATPIPNPVPPGGVTLYYGHDELSTARRTSIGSPYQGNFMADDFADSVSTPVVHIRWWGSYLPDLIPGSPRVQQFLIAWESDEPESATNPFSHPGEVKASEIVTRSPAAGSPPAGSFTETFKSPGGPPLGEELYEYNAELKNPFPQEADTVYWLKIVALNDVFEDGGIINWGWHNRDYTIEDTLASDAVTPGERDDRFDPPIVDPFYPTEIWHFQDNAVSGSITVGFDADGELFIDQLGYTPEFYVDGTDGPGPGPGPGGTTHGGIGHFSKDLAFELYTIPEPSAIVLAVFAFAALVVCAWRQRRAAQTEQSSAGDSR